MSSESRKFLASAFMLLLLVGIMVALTVYPIPKDNREIILTILAVLLGAGAAAIPNLFGDQKSEVTMLKSRIASLEQQQEVMMARYQEVKSSYDKITEMLIQRHVVEADGIKIEGEQSA
jgi:hypothetical protein